MCLCCKQFMQAVGNAHATSVCSRQLHVQFRLRLPRISTCFAGMIRDFDISSSTVEDHSKILHCDWMGSLAGKGELMRADKRLSSRSSLFVGPSFVSLQRFRLSQHEARGHADIAAPAQQTGPQLDQGRFRLMLRPMSLLGINGIAGVFEATCMYCTPEQPTWSKWLIEAPLNSHVRQAGESASRTELWSNVWKSVVLTSPCIRSARLFLLHSIISGWEPCWRYVDGYGPRDLISQLWAVSCNNRVGHWSGASRRRSCTAQLKKPLRGECHFYAKLGSNTDMCHGQNSAGRTMERI